MGGNKAGSKKAAETRRLKYGDDYHAEIGAVGGSRKVKKGMAVYLEKMTPRQKAAFYKRRGKRRWNN